MTARILSALAALTLLFALPEAGARSAPSAAMVAARTEAMSLATTDATETRRRWGPWVDIVGRNWVYDVPNRRYVAWMTTAWAVPGAAIDFAAGVCDEGKCQSFTALLAYSPKLSSEFSLWNPRRLPAFKFYRDNGDERNGAVGSDAYSRIESESYSYDAEHGMRSGGFAYREVSAQELASLTGSFAVALGVASGEPSAVNQGPAGAKGPASGQAPAPMLVAVRSSGGPIHVGRMGINLADRANGRVGSEARVLEVQADSPAARAGLQAGDVFQSIGGMENPSEHDVMKIVALAPGRLMPVVVLRKGQSVARSIQLASVSLPVPCAVLGRANYQYDGECRNGLAEGRGALSIAHNGRVLETYTGDFADGRYQGRGVRTTASSMYEGAFVDGVPQGRGKLTWFDGRQGFEGEFASGEPAGLHAYAEALLVCTRPGPDGSFTCSTPAQEAIAGGPATGVQTATPEAVVAASAQVCPSRRRLVSRTHMVWGCGYAATGARGTHDRGQRVEVKGRGTYQCAEREIGCRRSPS